MRCCRENSVAEARAVEGARSEATRDAEESAMEGAPPRAPLDRDFAARVLAWFDQHGRHDLPWQHPRSAYRVWVAEVMLQQTQVQTVIPYYLRFLQRFPTLVDVANADLDDVLALWSGLGYYSRARNLHRSAQICAERHRGELPAEFEAISALPGIGRSTAAAILAQAHGQRLPILDGNVRRVLSRYRAVVGDPTSSAVLQQLWSLAAALLPETRLADYTQALMDLGATVCVRRRPACASCPLSADCDAHLQGRVDDLPQSRVSRARPLRRSTLLWVHDDQRRLLLQRRAPTGIWAGLWSLVDGETPQQAMSTLRQLGVDAGEPMAMTSLRHEFTHFSLDIDVLSVHAVSVAIADRESRWCSTAEALLLGVPQPLRRLLEQHPAGPIAASLPSRN
jgi:A/G-specific adenine glycosylase